MSKDRIIHLLSDEEISYILSGLMFLGRKYLEQDCKEDNFLVQQLYDKIDMSSDVGVISNERM